ncbi:GNAT family N-acetyltransferase [Vibrio parahaemolyticus]|nr:GNAT family N-acetyltransferase [Vibrio parahaemolyticus]HAS6429017.1 GNAT family N-acetyltransferase [Vibrio parahaemolyticus]
MMLSIRRYRADDAPTLWTLFYHTVREVNCRDYQTDQVKAWAPDDFEPQTWQARMDTITPFIAEIEGEIVGYSDLQPDGFIDHFFCHHQHQRTGVGRALMAHIFSQAESLALPYLYSEVSITARPFFERMGFKVIKHQEVEVRGQHLTNYVMKKYLSRN